MPKTKLQNIIFTLIMAFVMVYAMVCYNIALDKGGMTNEIFLLAFYEIPIMWPVACILEYFVVEKLSRKLAFRMVSPEDKPIFITLAISSMIVCVMCPVMSLVASLLFYLLPGRAAWSDFPAVWAGTVMKNFPMAFFWNMFAAAGLTRVIFRLIFRRKKGEETR